MSRVFPVRVSPSFGLGGLGGWCVCPTDLVVVVVVVGGWLFELTD